MPRTWFGRSPVPTVELVSHFWSKVNKDGPTIRPDLGPCWIWTDGRKKNGYGQFYVGRRPVYAHRFAYELTRGTLAPGEVVRHRCDNGSGGCVRPEHLDAGSQLDNAQDCVSRGRTARGERNGQSKLSDAQVTALKQWRALRPDLLPGERALLGKMLGLSKNYLNEIWSGRKRAASVMGDGGQSVAQ